MFHLLAKKNLDLQIAGVGLIFFKVWAMVQDLFGSVKIGFYPNNSISKMAAFYLF